MAFKLKNDLLKNFSPIRRVDMEDGVLGKANNDGTIDVNKKVTDPVQFREVVKHEKLHQDQMNDLDKNGVPKLDYDDKNVYWKGKTYSRSSMDEGAKDLPWEKEVYDQTEGMNKSFKLKGYRGKMELGSVLANRGLIKKAGDKIKNRLQHKKVNVYTDEGDSFPGISDYAKKRTSKSKTYKSGGNKITKHKLMIPKDEYKELNPIYVEDREGVQKGRKYFNKKGDELAKSSLVRTGGDNLYHDSKATHFSGHAATPKGTKKQLKKYFSDRNTFMQ